MAVIILGKKNKYMFFESKYKYTGSFILSQFFKLHYLFYKFHFCLFPANCPRYIFSECGSIFRYVNSGVYYNEGGIRRRVVVSAEVGIYGNDILA
jgi:hypothetical protein